MSPPSGASGPTLLAALALFALATPGMAGTNDTVDGVVASARKGIEDTQNLQAAIDDATAVLNALQTDVAYQARVVDAINLRDPTTLNTLLAQKITRTTFSVPVFDTSQSFVIHIDHKTRGGKQVKICISSNRACGKDKNELVDVTVT